MKMDVIASGKRISLTDSREIGQGGEAVVYNVSDLFPSEPPRAVKIWRQPTDPFYISPGEPEVEKRNRDGARMRCKTYPDRLKDFPKNLPSRVIAPIEFVSAQRSANVLGYLMPLIEGSEPLLMLAKQDYKKQQGITLETVIEVFRDLHSTVSALHRKGVVIGDFNNRNILVKGKEAYVIDVDSMQFGGYQAPGFTIRYVDPRLCDPNGSKPVRVKPHNEDSDWFAFNCMLFEAILGVHPYGGVYMPKSKTDKVPHDARSLRRISVYHPEVTYPVRAQPLSSLPAVASEYFKKVFTEDLRGPFPEALLDALMLHARGQAVPTHLTLKGATSSQAIKFIELLSIPNGRILEASVQHGALRFLKHEGGTFSRETSRALFDGTPTREFRYRLSQDRTIFASGSRMIVFDRDGNIVEQLPVDQYRGKRPAVDANADHYYWISGGSLYRNDYVAPKLMGQVLPHQTLFWVGPSFGFGLSRAGDLSLAFVFDAVRSGINDSVKIPRISGEILDATCYFSERRAWFFYTTSEGGKLVNNCVDIKADGTVVGTAKADDGDPGWLGSIRGKCAEKHSLFSITDAGLSRIDERAGVFQEMVTYPDAAQVVQVGDRLFWNNGSLLVVSPTKVISLTLGP